ncbi:MAG: hypothetical protein K0R71_983 [Bacillales bacterium]|jgi:hypothetical protein|nr:hypothetical protein [Bacillales bacterium]
MAKDVVCSVDTCNYWEHGNQCTAEKIKVNNARSEAHASEETNCETFKPSDL